MLFIHCESLVKETLFKACSENDVKLPTIKCERLKGRSSINQAKNIAQQTCFNKFSGRMNRSLIF